MYWHWHSDTQQWLPQNTWSAADRALNYGDGLFETLRFDAQQAIPLWHYHQQRLMAGLEALNFPAYSLAEIKAAMQSLPISESVNAGKLLISRGQGERGYAAPKEAKIELLWHGFTAPSWALERFPNGLEVAVSPIVLAKQPRLAGIKHLNRLEQVLARNLFPEHCQEVVMCDDAQSVIEGCMSNIVLFKDNQWLTPSLDNNGVNGVIRQWLLSQLPIIEAQVSLAELMQADTIIFCNTLNGIAPVARLGEKSFDPQHAGWQQALTLQQQLRAVFC